MQLLKLFPKEKLNMLIIGQFYMEDMYVSLEILNKKCGITNICKFYKKQK